MISHNLQQITIILVCMVVCWVRPCTSTEIIIAGTEWAPFNSEKIEAGGFFTELTKTALERKGYKVKIVFLPWARALSDAKTGMVDALMGASYTVEREQFFVYPAYYWKSAITFFGQKRGKETYKHIEDLCPSSVGVLNGSFLIEELKSVDCLKLDLANDVVINIRKLIFGRIDLLLESRESIYYILNSNTEFREKKHLVIALSPPFQIDKVYTVFSKKSADFEKLALAYDQGIKKIKEDGAFVSILKKHGIR